MIFTVDRVKEILIPSQNVSLSLFDVIHFIGINLILIVIA